VNHTTRHPAANEDLIPIRVAKQLTGSLVGQTIFCAWFRIDSLGDHTYQMTVSQDAGDITLNRLNGETLWEGPDA